MAVMSAGELFGYAAPSSGNTVEIPIILTSAAGVPVTGVVFNAAGMVVKVRKEGGAYADFPTFDTNNWRECGYGEYVLIIRQSDATELALMDTIGTLTFYVICTATAGNFAKIKVNASDNIRLTINVGFSGSTDKTVLECLQAAFVQGGGKWVISGTTLTLYEPDGTTAAFVLTLDDADAPTSRTPA